MPAEARRLRHRIAGRDRWFLAVLASAALVATPTAVILSASGSVRTPDDGCVATVRASIMGAATTRYCGADAVAACRGSVAQDAELAAQCDRIGLGRYPYRPAPG